MDVRDKQGFTALHFAAQELHPQVVMLLMQHGASLHAMTNKRSTPLGLACGAELKGDSNFDQMRIVKLLLNGGSDLNHADKRGMSPLSIARLAGNQALVGYLLRKGAISTGVEEVEAWARNY